MAPTILGIVIGGSIFVAGLFVGITMTALAAASKYGNYIVPAKGSSETDSDTDLDLEEDLAELNS